MATDALARLMGSGRRSGGGSNPLPPVTDADNGDVLMVVDGAWDKGTIPASAEEYIIHINANNVATERSSDVFVAYKAGKQIKLQTSSTNATIPLSRAYKASDAEYILWFFELQLQTNYVSIDRYSFNVIETNTSLLAGSKMAKQLAYYAAP